MEPLSTLASWATTLIVPKLLGKAGEVIGQQLGTVAMEKSSETVQLVRKTVQDKLQAVGTAGLLKRAEEKPTAPNIQVLEGELVNQMEEDRAFADQLQVLIQQLQAEVPSLQIVLDTVRVKGNVEMGNIEQVSETGRAEQAVGRNVGVGGDLKIGDISQRQ